MANSFYRLSRQQLLASTRIVSDAPMHSGYDMGLAATADRLEIALPDFELDEQDLRAAEAALEAVIEAKRAHSDRRPFSESEAVLAESGEALLQSPGERLRQSQQRLADLARAVAVGDQALTALRRRGLQLTVTTWEESVLPFGDCRDASQIAAEVSIRRIHKGSASRA